VKPKLTLTEVAALGERVLREVGRAIVGKRALLERIFCAVLAGGHVLLEDYPGLAKTRIAKSFATALGLSFKRVQFTPDLLPGDITGGYAYDRATGRFVLRRGPIFANLVLADEINRASPKTQSALLEAMQEGQVTIEGETLRLPEPFIVLVARGPARPLLGEALRGLPLPRGGARDLEAAARAAGGRGGACARDERRGAARDAAARRGRLRAPRPRALILEPDLWMKRRAAEEVLESIVQRVPVPVIDPDEPDGPDELDGPKGRTG